MSHPTDVTVGIIGGSGVYKMDCLQNATPYKLDTPFGAPSDELIVATVKGVKCVFIPRHGKHHVVTPTEVNYRANIFALKMMGVKYLLSISAVGSLCEEMQPGDLVLIDQIIDRTYGRRSTFFGDGIVAHVPFGHPVCDKLHDVALSAVRKALPNVKVHGKGTAVTMEGPVFSTKAESMMNRQLGGNLIGMTTATEAKLAREAEIAFVSVCMVTDMDAWVDENHVDVSKVMKVLHDNAEHAQTFTATVIETLGSCQVDSDAHSALGVAIMTKPDGMPADRVKALQPLIGKYVPLK